MVEGVFCNCLRFSLFRNIFCNILLALACGALLALAGGLAFGDTKPQGKAEPTPGLVLAIMTPETVEFAKVPVGDTYTQSVRITNAGESTLQIKKITSSMPDFRVEGILLPVVVAHGTSETFTVAYRAKKERQVEGRILIFTDAGDAPLVLRVKGSGAAGQMELTASEAGIEFEDVAVGGSSKREVLLSNSGNRELVISAISVSGAGFSLPGQTEVHLGTGQSIGVDVNFAPKTVGRQTGSLSVTSADGASLLSLPLKGIAAPSSQSTVRLNWEESPVTVAGYVVYRSSEASGPYIRVSALAVPSAEFMDTGLAAGHTYYYVVTSLDGNEAESEFSAPISATIPEA